MQCYWFSAHSLRDQGCRALEFAAPVPRVPAPAGHVWPKREHRSNTPSPLALVAAAGTPAADLSGIAALMASAPRTGEQAARLTVALSAAHAVVAIAPGLAAEGSRADACWPIAPSSRCWKVRPRHRMEAQAAPHRTALSRDERMGGLGGLKQQKGRLQQSRGPPGAAHYVETNPPSSVWWPSSCISQLPAPRAFTAVRANGRECLRLFVGVAARGWRCAGRRPPMRFAVWCDACCVQSFSPRQACPAAPAGRRTAR